MVVFKKYYKFLISFLFIWSAFLGIAQSKVIDTLQQKTLRELLIIVSKTKGIKGKIFYANYIVSKGKKEKNRKLLLSGYHTQAILYDDENMLKYCDSIIDLTKSNNYDIYPAEAFELKGSFYYGKKNYKKALDNYLKASFFARKHKNESQIFSSNYSIAILKRKIGEKKEALELYKPNFIYARKNISKVGVRQYLNSITALANIFNDMNLPDSSSYYNNYGLKESKRLKNEYYYRHFSLNRGVSLFYKKEYLKAIDSLEKHIPYFENKKGKPNLSIAYYYTGISYLKINNYPKAIDYFKKLDTIFQEKGSIYPIARKSYEHLISYYKKNKDLKNQLAYINKLIKVDSVLHSDELYLSKGIFKEYDIPKLTSEKEVILKKMQEKDNLFQMTLLLVSIIILILIVFVVTQSKKRKIYKKRFEEILAKNEKTPNIENPTSKLNVPKEIELDILKGLSTFEQQQFLNSSITLNGLAKKLKTNTSYLSKVINYHKNNSFSNYINELRINYTVEELKSNTTFQKFTIKAIAEEAGFNNAESFAKAFYKLKGIKPSYFLREIQKMETKN